MNDPSVFFNCELRICFLEQVEFHPHLIQEDLLKFCRQHDIFFQAYSSLGTGEVCLNNSNILMSILSTIAKLSLSDKGFETETVYTYLAIACRCSQKMRRTVIDGYHAN